MQFGLLLAFISMYYGRWHSLLSGAHVMRGLLLLLLLLVLFSWGQKKLHPIINVLLVFLLLFLFLIPFARFTMGAYSTFIAMTKTVAISLIVFAVVDNWRKLASVVALLLVLHTYLAVTSLGGNSGGSEVVRLGAAGLAGGSWLGDPNDFALAVNIVLPFAVCLLLNRRGVLRIPLLVCCALLLAAIVVTYSRGGFLTLVASMTCLWLLKGRKMGVAAVAALLVGAVIVLAPQAYVERMKTISTVDENDTSYGRLQLWKAGLYMLRDNPLTGVGPGSYYGSFGRDYIGLVDRHSGKWKVAHSAYITIAAEMGLPGILIYCYLLYLAIKENLATRRLLLERGSPAWQVAICEGLICGLVAYAVGSAFLSVCYYLHLYFLAALSASLAMMVRQPAPERAREPGLAPRLAEAAK